MEQIKEINGLKVYSSGTWFEISLPHCGGILYSGTCAPNTDPKKIYDYCLPLSYMDGCIHEDVTLFFDIGSEIYSIHAEYALIANEDYKDPRIGVYRLWYSTRCTHVFNTVTFKYGYLVRPRRPRIVIVNHYITLPEQFSITMLKVETPQGVNMDAERPADPALLDSITRHLDRSGFTWTEM